MSNDKQSDVKHAIVVAIIGCLGAVLAAVIIAIVGPLVVTWMIARQPTPTPQPPNGFPTPTQQLAAVQPTATPTVQPTFTPSPPTPTPTPTPVPKTIVTIGALNEQREVQKDIDFIAVYLKTFPGAAGELVGDPEQGIVEYTRPGTGLATFDYLEPGTYVVCFHQQPGGLGMVGEFTLEAGQPLTLTFTWPPDDYRPMIGDTRHCFENL